VNKNIQISRPDPWVDPTRVQLCFHVKASINVSINSVCINSQHQALTASIEFAVDCVTSYRISGHISARVRTRAACVLLYTSNAFRFYCSVVCRNFTKHFARFSTRCPAEKSDLFRNISSISACGKLCVPQCVYFATVGVFPDFRHASSFGLWFSATSFCSSVFYARLYCHMKTQIYTNV
jgi:hypothetical protein